MKYTILVLLITIFSAQISTFAAEAETLHMEKTIKIKCTEMSCDACKRSITKSINMLEGIIKLDIDLETKMITVIIDDSKTDALSVLNAVVGVGYEAELVN